LLKMRNIHKRFDAVVALDGATLELRSGEIKALVGSNGSGKSTMVKILGGLVRPNTGEIYLDGKQIKIASAIEARKHGIAVAYQDLSLIPQMSVMDNIALGHEPLDRFGMIDHKKATEYAVEILDRLEIDCNHDDMVETLSPSTQSMIEVAKALSWKPRILLLDEVTAALHHDEVELLFDYLNELKNKSNLATVILTHRMDEIYRICDTATILRGGETVADVFMANTDLDEIIYHMTGKRPEQSQSEEHEARQNGKAILKVEDMHVLPKVRGISMEVKKGEIVGIGGLQGQGQSEFIRAILGVLNYHQGRVEFKGRNVKYPSAVKAVKDGLGFISGDRTREAVFPIRSIAENIYVTKSVASKYHKWLSWEEVNGEASKIVKEFNIKIGSLSNPANSLSGGNQQKVVVGRWMNIRPELLLLDDPTKGVDVTSRGEIHKILLDAVSRGMTVIIVSSDNKELLDICDRVYVFYEGEISGVLTGDDMTEERLVTAMMGINGHRVSKEGA